MGYDRIQVHHHGFERLPATESEKLLSQSGRTGGGGANFRDVISEGALDLALVQKQIAITENGGEKIVEIVGEPGGKLAERFHFLRAAELSLQLFAGVDIHERNDLTLGCAVVGT